MMMWFVIVVLWWFAGFDRDFVYKTHYYVNYYMTWLMMVPVAAVNSYFHRTFVNFVNIHCGLIDMVAQLILLAGAANSCCCVFDIAAAAVAVVVVVVSEYVRAAYMDHFCKNYYSDHFDLTIHHKADY
jgi:hypothetical protein